MAASITDKFAKVISGTTRPVATTLSAQKISGATSATVVATTGWDTATAVHGIMYRTDAGTGAKVAGSQIDWKGVISGTTISNFTVTAGTDDTYAIGTTVELSPTAAWGDDMATGLVVEHNQDGTHAAMTAPSIVVSGNVTAANFIQSGGAGAEGWTLGLPTPNTVTYNGNRSYDLVFNADDLTDTVSPGMRLRTTRTVVAPTRCTSLNGTNQYYSKSSPAGMTFTDDFVVGAWVKVTSYAAGSIVSRYNGTSGWRLHLNASGQVELDGFNAASGNFSFVQSYQSLPLNKWVHVTAQLDMSAFTATTTTSYVMIDGVDVPAAVGRGGTNPTALIQAGDLQIGASNGSSFFPGKIAQAWYAPAKVTQANVRTICSQGVTAALITSLSLGSAWSFDNAITDLNTTNANNLTANGSAVATNADSPFSVNSFGTAGGSLDYAIVQKSVFSTNTTLTVQVPEGNTIPTSGGVSAVAYSSQDAPYGLPKESDRWRISAIQLTNSASTAATTNVTANLNSFYLTVPGGKYNLYGTGASQVNTTAGNALDLRTGISTTTNSFTEVNDYHTMSATLTYLVDSYNLECPVSLTAATPYYLNVRPQGTGTLTAGHRGDIAKCELYAEPAYL